MVDYKMSLTRRARGIGLLELMLALAIIAVLIIMATRYYQTTARAARINEAVAQINAVTGAAGQYMINHGSFAGVTEQKLVDMGLLSANSLKTPWGGDLFVRDWQKNTLYIRFPNVLMSHPDCVAILDRLKGKNFIQGGGPPCTIDYRTTRDA